MVINDIHDIIQFQFQGNIKKTLHEIRTFYSYISLPQGALDAPNCSHIAHMVYQHVGRFPAFNKENTERTKALQCSLPCVGVSVPWVSPEVKGQLVRGMVCLQSVGKVQQLSRLDEVGAVHDKKQFIHTFTTLVSQYTSEKWMHSNATVLHYSLKYLSSMNDALKKVCIFTKAATA